MSEDMGDHPPSDRGDEEELFGDGGTPNDNFKAI